MGVEITISSKGQIAIPKTVRDRLGLKPGQKLSVTESGGAIVLRPALPRQTLTFEEAEKRLRALIRYEGAPVSIEEMNATIDAEWAKSGTRGDL